MITAGEKLILEFLALSIYVSLMGFCFCDGFKLKTSKKLIWFFMFLLISFYVFKLTGEFDLALILPVPCLAAIILGFRQIKCVEK